MRSKLNRFLAVLGVAGLLALPAAPALAEDPVTIPSGQNIVDSANVLGSRKAEVQDAIQKLLKDHKYNLYVITAKTFENPADPEGVGPGRRDQQGHGQGRRHPDHVRRRQVLLLPQLGQRHLSQDVDTIVQNAIVPNLAGGKRDFAQAAIDTAAAVGDAAGGGSGTVPSGAGAGSAVLVGVGVVAVGGAGTYLYLRSRRKKALQSSGASAGAQGAQPDPLAGLSVAELRRKSDSLLIEADDAIKSSEQELGFAQAQYGDAAVGNFTKALQEAKGHMTESFKLQQQLDDHIPDTEEQQRSWLVEIIGRSEAALASLQEQKADFDSLRELEKNAPQALAAVGAGAADAEAKLASRRTVADRSAGQVRRERPGPGRGQHQTGQGTSRLRAERLHGGAGKARRG